MSASRTSSIESLGKFSRCLTIATASLKEACENGKKNKISQRERKGEGDGSYLVE